ncbi:hypothetical protein EU537_03915 [Candidatus Thorarchaeota archaeon]|nr:MAG: hypothetical protein EU537_03915 [Candidatus Thorarchaeota archaeon]
MIRLVGVLTEGGVPVEIRSFIDTDGEMLIGALISAAKMLCAAMDSGEVHRLAFRDNTLIVFESKSGYTVVALVDKGAGYAESQLRIIAEEIDNSNIPDADGSVTKEHTVIINKILDTYVKHDIAINLEEVLDRIWPPLISQIGTDSELEQILERVDKRTETTGLVEKWQKLKSQVHYSMEDALEYALQGRFDKACAASIDSKNTLELTFAIKMGTLALQMTETSAPPLSELVMRVDRIKADNPFSSAVVALVKFLSREIDSRDYSKFLRKAADIFKFRTDPPSLLQSFVFMDGRISEFPEFAGRLVDYYQKAIPVARAYIYSIIDRNEIFEKLYSVSSYDDFKSKMGFYKGRIQGILSQLSSVLDEKAGISSEPVTYIKMALQSSLQLQNYITLLTALSESPVLTVSERKEVLEEVLEIYWKYFRSLLRLNIPIFAHTVDSVFQSLSVACAEYYRISTGEGREAHLEYIDEFLTDVSLVVHREWNKTQIRLSIFVLINAIGPILARVGRISHSELELLYSAMKQYDSESTMSLRESNPSAYMTNVGNLMVSIAALSTRIKIPKEKLHIRIESFRTALAVHQWFVSHGMVCRDDIMSVTFLAGQILELLDRSEVERVLKVSVALNRIAIQDYTEYDYELAMMGTPLLLLLIQGSEILDEPIYSHLANDLLQRCIGAWRKYGFHEKAENLDNLIQQEINNKKGA